METVLVVDHRSAVVGVFAVAAAAAEELPVQDYLL
jgi:hypothetical protein